MSLPAHYVVAQEIRGMLEVAVYCGHYPLDRLLHGFELEVPPLTARTEAVTERLAQLGWTVVGDWQVPNRYGPQWRAVVVPREQPIPAGWPA